MAATTMSATSQYLLPTKASHISLAENNQLKTGSGRIFAVVGVATGTTFALAIYDSPTTTDNQMAAITVTAGVTTELNIPFQTGLRVVSSGTPGRAVVLWA